MAQPPRLLSEFKGLVSNYRLFLFDQYGVLHQGRALYPHVRQTLHAIKKEGGKIALVSNSGRSASENTARLQELGLQPSLFDAVVTSGDSALRAAAETAHAKGLFLLTPEHDTHIFQSQGIATTTRLVEASGLFLGGVPQERGAAARKLEAILRRARECDLLFLCANPDRWALGSEEGGAGQGGEIVFEGPGEIAMRYQRMGGRVSFFGKPWRPIFDEACAHFPDIAHEQTLMIGDMLHTDIAGACGARLDSLLIMGGVHRADFANLSDPQKLAQRAVALGATLPQEMHSEFGEIAPTFLAEDLRWSA